MPALSVLLPNYNGAPYLADAINCILGQTFRDFECLVLDDGSEDESSKIVDTYRDPRLRLIPRPHLGLGATLEYGLHLCKAPFFARMDSDDQCSPERFARQMQYLKVHKDVGAVGTQFTYFGDTGMSVPSPTLPLSHSDIRRELLRGNHALCHATMVMRTELLINAGGYRIHGMGEDWDMFLRLTENATVANLPDVLYYYRVHRGNSRYRNIYMTRLGIEYAKQTAKLRNMGCREIDFEEFRRARRHELTSCVVDAAGTVAQLQYRRALEEFAEGKKLRGASRIVFASLFAPRSAARRVRQKLHNTLSTVPGKRDGEA